MELCENGTVRDVLKHRPPWNLVVRLILDIARGIDFLHGENIVHRYKSDSEILPRMNILDLSLRC
jgi:serine/threonine protein kinase